MAKGPKRLNRVNFKWINNPSVCYGLHQLNLGFGEVSSTDGTTLKAKNLKVGSKSLGLSYDNAHTARMFSREMCIASQKNIDFLRLVHRSIQVKYNRIRQQTMNFMRVNVVVGAKTKWHTDTMRGATPSFILIKQGHSFQLQVRNFPHFRSSVVIYKGKKYIPHELGDKEIVLIGQQNGKAQFFLGPVSIFDKLQPFGTLEDWIIVGIKKGKLQVISSEFEAIGSPKDLDLINFENAVEEAELHPQTIPRRNMRFLTGKNGWEKFHGWKHAHSWFEYGDSHLS
jgi:hypothetical protein